MEIYKCIYCNKECKNIYHLKNHIKNHILKEYIFEKKIENKKLIIKE